MATTHKCEWIVLYHSFDPIEQDEPYTVYYCACGQRLVESMTDNKIDQVCQEQGWAREKVLEKMNQQILAKGGEA